MAQDPGFGSQMKSAVERKLDEHGLSQTDYVKAALKWQYNWIGLAGAAAFAIVSGTGLPLVMAAGLELMYMALVPQSSKFRRLVRSWKYAEEKRQHDLRLYNLFRELPVEMRSRYEFVNNVVQTIRTNYSMLSSTSQIFVRQMEEKLTGLMSGYVRLLHAAHTHTEYLRTFNPEHIRREVQSLETGLAKESPKVQEINQRRIDILRKRIDKFQKIRDNKDVINAQCAAIEDVLQLIRDQSVTMRDPQEVSAQLDHLVSDVEQTETTVREVEAIFALASPDSTEEMPPLPETGGQRTRVRN
jgi:hypothetical protein